MAGYQTKDIRNVALAGHAGCGKTILVKTGIHANTAERLAEQGLVPDYLAEDLLDAANWIIAGNK